ncbi:MAG: DUF3137 domain-containing protein [Candidatus Gracilibacteria bacterium]|nr:DUF3137 domain-containing protein [Candidatus Gracilibacteria bacterium]
MIENNILTMNGEMNGVKFIGGEYRGFDEYSGSGGEDSLGGYLFKFTYEKNIANSKYPVLLNPFSFDIEDKKKYKEVHFSNVDFSSKFKVYSQDEIDAKKILKPKFMYQLYDYVTCFNTTYYYRFYIYKNEINIIFTFPPYQGDSGELNSNRELDTFFQKYQEISHVLNFIKQVKF